MNFDMFPVTTRSTGELAPVGSNLLPLSGMWSDGDEHADSTGRRRPVTDRHFAVWIDGVDCFESAWYATNATYANVDLPHPQ